MTETIKKELTAIANFLGLSISNVAISDDYDIATDYKIEIVMDGVAQSLHIHKESLDDAKYLRSLLTFQILHLVEPRKRNKDKINETTHKPITNSRQP